MLNNHRFMAGSLAVVIGAGALIAAPSAHALRQFVTLFQLQYPTSQTDDNTTDGCPVCHGESTSFFNPYAQDWWAAKTGTTTDELLAAFVAIEGVDSDTDPTGSDNLTEITAGTQPGWAEGDNPTGVTGLLDPAAPAPDISVSPLAVDFGAVTVGASGTAEVNIANAGTADLEVTSLTLSGSTEFSLPGAPAVPFTVAPNTSVNLTVEYAPVDENTDNGTLEIASDSPGEELLAVALSGTGIPVQVEECVASVAPASIDFGSVEIGNSMTLSTTISNDGGAACTVDATMNGSVEYTFASASSFTVAPGGSADLVVDYAPVDLGDDAGSLELAVASPADTIIVPLAGSGFEAPVETLDLDIKRFSATKKVSVSKAKLIGLKLTVQNNGLIDGFATATVTGTQGGFEVYNQTMTVTDGVGNGSTTYNFPSYQPDTAGDITWTAVIADEDPDDDAATVITIVVP